jgi:hypothetical protein
MRRSAKGHSRLTRMLPRHDVVLTGEQQHRLPRSICKEFYGPYQRFYRKVSSCLHRGLLVPMSTQKELSRCCTSVLATDSQFPRSDHGPCRAIPKP